MAYYIKQHKFFDDRLTIFKKTSSKNWIGRCWIDGKGKEISSRLRNFNEAKSFLMEWYRGLQYRLKNELPIHDLQFNKLFKQYISFRKSNKKSQYSKNISISFNAIIKSFFYNRKINSINKKTIINYISWRVKKFKKENKKEIAYSTLVQDLMMMSGFMNWCFENKHREKKLAISKKWITEVVGINKNKDTSRTYLTIKEWDKLLSTSRKRIRNVKHGHTLTKFRREYLHQFIIFMVHSGLRTGEGMNLTFGDIKMVEHKRSNKKYCILNVSGKTGAREVYTTFGCYFAVKKIKELLIGYYGKKSDTTVAGGYVFNQKFRRGLNDLLESANLKTQKSGDKTLYRDSKSFRSTYISWAVIRGENIKAIALNCGTSAKVIEDFYTKNIEVKTFKKELSQISKVEALHMNGS